MEKKKNPSGFIIPATYFRSKNIPEVTVTRPVTTPENSIPELKEEIPAVVEKVEEPKETYPKKELPIPSHSNHTKTFFGTLVEQYSKEKRASNKAYGC